MRKRSLIFSIIVAVSLFTFALGISPEAKAAYPDKPIRLIVPFPAGTRTSLHARSAMS
jgi:tripartite-type tricarboxylate transporter receptor subunit TctC